MERKSGYKSRHRDEIMAYFQSHADRHVTAGDIYGFFREQGGTMGMTTIYRQLDRLVQEGILNKYTIEVGSPSCYEYSKGSEDSVGSACFHCKCEICGRLIHLKCQEAAELRKHLSEEHAFTVNPMRTVFYGVCSDCSQNKK